MNILRLKIEGEPVVELKLYPLRPRKKQRTLRGVSSVCMYDGHYLFVSEGDIYLSILKPADISQELHYGSVSKEGELICGNILQLLVTARLISKPLFKKAYQEFNAYKKRYLYQKEVEKLKKLAIKFKLDLSPEQLKKVEF